MVCDCNLCVKINHAISQRNLKIDEVAEIASHIVEEELNMQYFCVACHDQVEEGRAQTRQKLGFETLCPTCAANNSPTKYVGANVGGNLIKTSNPHLTKFVEKFNRGSHAMQ